MATTRSQNGVTALKHILDELGFEEGSIVEVALTQAGVTDISGLLLLEVGDFQLITATIETDTQEGTVVKEHRIGLVTRHKLLAVKRWYLAQETSGIGTWHRFTQEDFIEFVANEESNAPIIAPPNFPSPITNSATSLANDFQKGIKRSLSDYPKLGDDRFWLSYKRKLTATAAIHDVSEVLNPEYIPPPELEDIFQAKNKFVYSVFVNSLQTSKSRRIVRKYSSTLDGQAVFSLLENEYSKGATAELAIERLQNDLLKLKLDDRWPKSLESFLDMWDSKVEDLETLMDTQVSDDRKHEWLSSAIRPHAELYGAVFNSKIISATLRQMNGSTTTKLGFSAMFSLVKEHAVQIDGNKEQNKRGRKAHQASQYRGNSSNGNRHANTHGNLDTKDYSKDTRKHIPPHEWEKMTGKQRVDFCRSRNTREGRPPNQNRRTWNRQTNQAKTHQNSNSSDSGGGTENSVNSDTNANPKGGSAIQRMLSNAQSTPSAPPQTITHGGRTYRLAMANLKYQFWHGQVKPTGSLVDSGANGGLAGDDVRVLSTSFQKADVSGIGDSSINNLNLCTVAGVIQTTSGPIVGIFHQYANYGSGKTIHSANQMASFGIDVNERPKNLVGGRQSLVTPDGFVIPLAIRQGLAYMDMHPPTDRDLDELTHVVFTGDSDWDPSMIDSEVDADVLQGGEAAQAFGEVSPDDNLDFCVFEARRPDPTMQPILLGPRVPTVCPEPTTDPAPPYLPKSIVGHKPDFEALRPFFGWIPADRVRDTLKCTTQWYRMSQQYPMRKHFKTRFPAANVNRLHDKVATDTLFSDTPAHDDGIMGHGGATMIQVYVGVETRLTEAFPMTSETQMSTTLMDFIRRHGAPDVLVSDNAKSEIGKKVQDILRNYCIADYQSEPHYQNQNSAQRRIQDIKNTVNNVMDRTGTPAKY